MSARTLVAAGGEPDLVRPFASHRVKIYFGAGVFVAIFYAVMTIGSQLRLIPPTLTTDVIANAIFIVYLFGLPFVVFWDGRGEQRSRLEKAAELTLVYLPFTAASQLTYELPFLIGQLLGWWKPTNDPGWQWFWWQYAQADTRYWGDNPYIFATEFVAISAGAAVMIAWVRLIRSSTSDETRIKSLWVAFLGVTALLSCTLIYYISEVKNGFAAIGQGFWYGVAYKFFLYNGAFIIFPGLVLFAIYLQVDYLTRRSARREALESVAEPRSPA